MHSVHVMCAVPCRTACKAVWLGIGIRTGMKTEETGFGFASHVVWCRSMPVSFAFLLCRAARLGACHLRS